jgi:CRISPR-associated protein Cmr6
LWLDRFVLYERRGNQWEQSRQSKKREGAPLNFQPLNQLLAACRRRWEAMLQSYEPNVVQFTASPEWRIIIGLGAGHVLETSITLHRIYGVPFIPASAVKGVTRAQAFWDIAERLNVPEPSLPLLDRLLTEGKEKAQKETWEKMRLNRDFGEWQDTARDFYAVFGNTERQGQVLFFDAYPTQAPRLKLDIMNPHYAPYYSDTAQRTPPADYHSPVPVYLSLIHI